MYEHRTAHIRVCPRAYDMAFMCRVHLTWPSAQVQAQPLVPTKPLAGPMKSAGQVMLTIVEEQAAMLLHVLVGGLRTPRPVRGMSRASAGAGQECAMHTCTALGDMHVANNTT